MQYVRSSALQPPRSRLELLTVVIAAASVLAAAGCATSPDPPFQTDSYPSRVSAADSAFGWYAYFPADAPDVRIRRVFLAGDWDRGYEKLPVDVYYPPQFHYRRAEPAVIVLAGAVKWSSNISLAAMLAAEGVVAVVLDTLGAGERLQSAIDGLAAQGADLLIDTSRLAVWSEGHAAPEVLEALLDPDWRMHGAMRAGVFISPVMCLGRGAGFRYDPAQMATDVPIFIARAAGDDMYEVRTSITRFMEAAEPLGMDVQYVESPIGGHNWMLEEPDPAATDVIREAVGFLKTNL